MEKTHNKLPAKVLDTRDSFLNLLASSSDRSISFTFTRKLEKEWSSIMYHRQVADIQLAIYKLIPTNFNIKQVEEIVGLLYSQEARNLLAQILVDLEKYIVGTVSIDLIRKEITDKIFVSSASKFTLNSRRLNILNHLIARFNQLVTYDELQYLFPNHNNSRITINQQVYYLNEILRDVAPYYYIANRPDEGYYLIFIDNQMES